MKAGSDAYRHGSLLSPTATEVSTHLICRPGASQSNAGGYNMWWPYVKNYHGETTIGRYNNWNWAKYIWIDQDMKNRLLGR